MSTTHKFTYTYDVECPLTRYYEGNLKQCDIVISSTDEDMTVYQMFNLFKSYIVSVGYSEKSFYDACEFYFNEYTISNNYLEEIND
jgi:hypothetical protein